MSGLLKRFLSSSFRLFFPHKRKVLQRRKLHRIVRDCREKEVEMEREEEQKKTPIAMDWTRILPKEETGPPPELVVVSAVQYEMEGLSDLQLKEKIDRFRSNYKSLASKLPDKGEKLLRNLKNCEEELERRNQLRIKEDEHQKSMQARNSWSPGACNGFSSETPLSQAPSQSEFASRFSQNLQPKPDLSSQISVNGSDKDHSFLGRGNNQNKGSNGSSLKKGRRETKAVTRQSPFRCSKNSSGDGDEHKSRVGVPNAIDSSSFYQPHEDGKSSSYSSKRRKTFDDQTPRNSRRKECETVVLVDEEDGKLVETSFEQDEPAGRMESKIYYPSSDDPESVELHYSDIKSLAPEAFLSSTIMNFYIRYLQCQESATGRSRSNYHFFSTYFYGKVKEAVSCKRDDKETLFSKFRRWWKGVNIFEKPYILLPINEDYHWSLVIICLPTKEDGSGPIMLHLDSLGLHNTTQIFKNVKSFLIEEWKYLRQNDDPPNLPFADMIWGSLPSKIVEKKVMVPQQRNDYDCGIFVLFFMERFIKESPERFRTNNLDMFGRRWFKAEEASRLRGKIRKLIEKEFEKPIVQNESKEEASPSSSGDDSASSVKDLTES